MPLPPWVLEIMSLGSASLHNINLPVTISRRPKAQVTGGAWTAVEGPFSLLVCCNCYRRRSELRDRDLCFGVEHDAVVAGVTGD